MFLNSETQEINVVYERNHGGYGVIQPRKGNGHTHHNGKNGKAIRMTTLPQRSSSQRRSRTAIAWFKQQQKTGSLQTELTPLSFPLARRS
jgi:hypothetical protein